MLLFKQKIIFTFVCFLALGFVLSAKYSLADPFQDVGLKGDALKAFLPSYPNAI